jgi:isoquinoline 1-oxidoreductase beta subunit
MNASVIKASADKKGNLLALSFKIAVQPLLGGRASVEGIENMFYHIPHLQVERVDVDLPVTFWFWRSVGSTHNAFILETFLDKMAKTLRIDPVEFRLKLLKNEPVPTRVVERVAEISGWGKKPKKGEVFGMAYHYSFGSHVAEVAEVIYDEKKGSIRVPKVYCVIDNGPVAVHPDLIRSQMEGAICMGLSAALKEAVKFEKGGIANTNFHAYELLTIDDAPEVEVEILNSDRPMGGVGEPGLPPIAPAVANALLWGYGLDITRLPLTFSYLKTLKNS